MPILLNDAPPLSKDHDGWYPYDAARTLGIASELTGRRRDRAFGYARYIALLAAGTERP